MSIRLQAATVAGLLVLSACSSSGDEPSAEKTTEPPHVAPACPTNSGYAQDEACLQAPLESKGFQLHYGPADYDDPDDVAQYLVDPGQEIVACYFTKTSNQEDVFSTGYQIHMRPGSHHLILNTQDKPVPDGFTACGTAQVSPGGLGGTQVPTVDNLTDPAPENQGLAIKVKANTQAMFNFHLINTTQDPILGEAWANYMYAPDEEVLGYRGAVFLAGGLGFRIAPKEKKTYRYSCSPTVPSRILQLAAHMHEHATRMTAWKVSKGVRTKILESFNWEEPGEVLFNSAHTNAAPDQAARVTGADMSGELVVQPDETVEWECAVENTSNITLTFKNEVITGEMCVLTGAQVRADDPMQQSDFACIRN